MQEHSNDKDQAENADKVSNSELNEPLGVKTDPKLEADKLRQEAKDLLNKLFCGALRITPSDDDVSISLSAVDRVVDCIVYAAVLEVASLQREAILNRPTCANH